MQPTALFTPRVPEGAADHDLKTTATVSGVEATNNVQGEGRSGHNKTKLSQNTLVLVWVSWEADPEATEYRHRKWSLEDGGVWQVSLPETQRAVRLFCPVALAASLSFHLP